MITFSYQCDPFDGSRAIVPVNVPIMVNAVDVTELNEEDTSAMILATHEYEEYLRSQVVFSFADWLEHTSNPSLKRVKMREYRLTNFIKNNAYHD